MASHTSENYYVEICILFQGGLISAGDKKQQVFVLFESLFKSCCYNPFVLLENIYIRSQILECPSIGQYWNISGVPVLAENVIFTFFRKC